MFIKILTIVFFTSFVAVNSLPARIYYGNAMALRSKRDPNQAMFITGYYNHHANGRPNGYNYESRMNPENNCRSCGGDIVLPLEETPNVEEKPEVLLQEVVTENIEAPVKLDELIPQKEVQKQKKKPEESDEDDEEFPLFKPNFKGQQPYYSFFPIFLGGGGLARSGDAPNGATAIANSFSTGKRGVATSTATAYGDPSPFLRNRNVDLRHGQ